jgi:site-specific DNA-methyltransferase (adenine-specific)
VSLRQADARTFLARLADESVDLVLTDPPYEFERGTTYFRDWFADLPDEAWPGVLAQCFRVLREDRHAYVICDRRTEEIFIHAGVAAGFRFVRKLIWNKGTPALGQGAYRSQYELVLLFSKGKRAGNSRCLGDVLTFPRVMTRGHYRTEKPVGLLKTLISQSSQPGELVLDPFCGSGSTGRAARELGRRALLSDLDASTAAAALRVAFVPLESAAATRNGAAL